MSNSRPVLFFDSGIGGLSVLREARVVMPERLFMYVVDNEAFPYGSWQEDALRKHLVALMRRVLEKYNPLLCVLACNTASTLALNDLRTAFPNYPFVGTVPAVKPAAEHTMSGLVSVLATPGTVRRVYTRDLVTAYAGRCSVNLVGSERLASFAEDHLRGKAVDCETVWAEILPCFIEREGKHTDIVVLACTHYPFLTNLFRKLAPWPVDWLDPAEAIAQRARSLLPPCCDHDLDPGEDVACFTSGQVDFATKRLFHGFGLKYDGPV